MKNEELEKIFSFFDKNEISYRFDEINEDIRVDIPKEKKEKVCKLLAPTKYRLFTQWFFKGTNFILREDF